MPQELEFVRAPRTCDSADEPFAFQGTDAAPSLWHGKRDLVGHPLYGRPSFSVSAGKLQQTSKDQLLGRKEIAAPQDLRRNERSSKRLNGLNACPTSTLRLDRRSWREVPRLAGCETFLCWRISRLSDTLWAVTVLYRTASPKPFLLKAPLQRCL